MKKTIVLFFAFQLLVMWTISCARHGQDGLRIVEGYWGHLTDLEQTTASPMYLAHLEKGQTYKICMGQNISKKYPGIEEEIKASINIWAAYLGREIPVEFSYADLPQATADDNNHDLMDTYYARCPKGIHLVFGESPFDDASVGMTFTSYSYIPQNGPRKITQFKRALFLRLPATSSEEDDVRVTWKSLNQTLGKTFTAAEILELMKKRDQTAYLPGDHELLTLTTLVHEFGHVWGLCDQYALDGDETNCDGKYATLDGSKHILLHDEAIMARASWAPELYLSNDDIEGIRKLGARDLFVHNWPTKDAFNQIAISPIVPANNISFAQISQVKREMNRVKLRMVISTLTPVRIKVRFYEKNYESWLEMNDTVYQSAVSLKPLNLEIDLGRPYNIQKVEVSFVAFQGQEVLGEPVVITRSLE